MSSQKIIASFWMKPIPRREFDWTATLDNYEPGDPVGCGASEAEAVADLTEKLEE